MFINNKTCQGIETCELGKPVDRTQEGKLVKENLFVCMGLNIIKQFWLFVPMVGTCDGIVLSMESEGRLICSTK
jgi:hypothetical protein